MNQKGTSTLSLGEGWWLRARWRGLEVGEVYIVNGVPMRFDSDHTLRPLPRDGAEA